MVQNKNHFLGTLGLCRKAGGCVIGEDTTLKSIRSEKARCVFLSSGASDNTKKRFQDACAFHHIRLLLYDPIDFDVPAAIGKPNSKVMAVTDKNWGDSLLAKADMLQFEQLS